MKEKMRGAASALLFAGIVLAYLYFFHPSLLALEPGDTQQNAGNEAVVAELEDTIMELESLNQTLDNDLQNLEEEILRLEETAEDPVDPDDHGTPIIHAMLEISPGETSSAISERLFDLQIIDSRNAFESELNMHNRADRIQTGSFFLTSDMENEEIIEIITNP